MKKKFALLLVILMLYGMNSVALAEEATDIQPEGAQGVTLDVQPRDKSTAEVQAECSFKRDGLFAAKSSLSPGEETVIRMGYTYIFDPDLYEACTDYIWSIGTPTCEVQGNTSEKTVLENRGDYANTRYLIVGEDETAEELTVIFNCSGWRYYVKEKASGNVHCVYSDEVETLELVIKIGEKTTPVGLDKWKDITVAENNFVVKDEDSSDNNQQPEKVTNTVSFADGTSISSTIGGIYQVTNVAGVAITTPREQVEAATGIVSGEGKTALYICNNYNQAATAALEQAAKLNGKQSLTTFTMDLYTIREAEVRKVHNTISKVRIVIGVPDQYKNTGKAYTIGIIGRDGEFYVLEDMDNDPNTITIETDQFGVMALLDS